MNAATPQAKSIFGKALEIGAVAERAAYLDQACGGDAALRAEVDSLLAALEGAGDFLRQPAAAPGATVDPEPASDQGEPKRDPVTAEAVGSRVGPYKLLQPLGEGGMGAVWVAEQTEPVKRRVALKVIKPGMDSAQVLRRFEAERQALALMDHSHIAKVFDAGTTETGRPYFVMELIKGVPITKYCDELHLPIRERLALFVPVCQALQHAHQKGIIHRDIKPSNVLVCMQDGKPVAAADVNRREAERIAQKERAARQHALETLQDITNHVANRNMTTLQVAAGGLSVKGGDVQELLTSPLTAAEKELLSKLLTYYESAARDFAGAADDPTALAGTYLQIGQIRKTFRDYTSAEVAYRAALMIYEELAKNQPSVPENTELLKHAHENLAQTLRSLGRDVEAVGHWDSVIRLSSPEDSWEIRLPRAGALARAGRVAEAVTECEAVVSESASRGSCCYNAACVYAQAAANSQACHEEYARAGVGFLRRALEKGEFTSLRATIAIAYLKLDPDLDPLRGRKDFQRIAAAAFTQILSKQYPEENQDWVTNIEPVAQDLLQFSAEDAEPTLRKCLEIRLRDEPGLWTTFHTKSLLGGSLLGQKKYAAAEPLLLAGYEGMKQREDQLPKVRLAEALERLVKLYDATGKKDKADGWRKKLQEAKAPPKPPAKP